MIKIKMVCSKCKKTPYKNKKNSNNNWSVYDNKPCEFCGGKLKIDTTGEPK